MFDRRIIYFTIFVFSLINGAIFLQGQFTPSKSFDLPSNTEFIIYSSRHDKIISVTISVNSFDGEAFINYFDWDYTAHQQLNPGSNHFQVQTNRFSILTGDDVHLQGNFKIQVVIVGSDLGIVLLFPAIFIVGFLTLLARAKLISVSDSRELANYAFFVFNLSLFLAIPSITTLAPFILFFFGVEIVPSVIIYLTMVILIYILFFVNLIGHNNKKIIQSMPKLLYNYGLLSIIYSALVVSESGLPLGILTLPGYMFLFTALFFLIYGLTAVEFSKNFIVIENPEKTLLF
jgi:hypothetical protein